MTLDPFAAGPQYGLLAATPVTGYTLVNGTGTVLTWTAPADGRLHRVFAASSLLVTVGQTGGTMLFSAPVPGGANANSQLFAGGQAAGSYGGFGPQVIVSSGATVTVTQFSAMTLGAAVFYGELWGS